MTACRHPQITTGPERCYMHGVARPPYTTENRAAHGGVAYRETCLSCGATREVLQNGRHLEFSPWTQPLPAGPIRT